jgi:hypothetical protein
LEISAAGGHAAADLLHPQDQTTRFGRFFSDEKMASIFTATAYPMASSEL